MSSYNGHAFISGLAPSGTTVTIGGYGTCFVDSAPLQHVSRLTEHIGADGKTGALQWDDDHYEMSLTFRPAKKGAVMESSKGYVTIRKGSKVTLTGFHVINEYNGKSPQAEPIVAGDLTAILNVDWIVVGDTAVNLNAAGNCDVQLQLRHYPGNVDIKVMIPTPA